MANSVLITPYFEKKYKRFAKKFTSLDDELLALESDLKANPKLGESLGANIYKIRLASKDKGRGKSGGFRVITYLVQELQNSCAIYLTGVLKIAFSSLTSIFKMLIYYSKLRF